MANPATIEYTSWFVKGQSALGTPATLANSDAICVVSGSMTEAGTRAIERTDVMCGYGGAAPPVQGDKYLEISLTVELVACGTVGDSSTWKLLPLFQATPSTITDVALTSTTYSRKASTIPMTDWIPLTISAQTRNGVQRTATDVMLQVVSITANAGERILVEFAGSGKFTVDANTTLTAPAPSGEELPIVAMNGSLVDSISNKADFGYTLETGLVVTPLKDSSETYGWGTPMGVAEGACVFSYPVLAQTGYESDRADGTDIGAIVATYGAAKLTLTSAYIANIDASETDGAQTYDITVHSVFTSSAADWYLELT